MNGNSMNRHDELTASLGRLGIRELEERMEVSTLLAASDVQVSDRCVCEGCCSSVDLPTPTIQVGFELYPPDHLGI